MGYALRWPDGHEVKSAVFTREDAELPGAIHLSLEDERIRALTTQLPVFAPGQPIPTVLIPGVSDKVSGFWSLWRISLQTGSSRQQRCMALFVSHDSRVLGPTARTIWDRLIDLPNDLSQSAAMVLDETAVSAFEGSRRAAEVHGAAIFEELAAAHREGTRRERKKGSYAFAARKRAIERLGLPQVKARRLVQLAEEERIWSMALAARETAVPELTAITIVQVARQDQP